MDSEEEEIVYVPKVVDVAKVEVTRQTIVFVFGVAGTLATVYIARKFNDPDNWSTFKMWGALTIKRWADAQSARFARLATHMANVYNGEKL